MKKSKNKETTCYKYSNTTEEKKTFKSKESGRLRRINENSEFKSLSRLLPVQYEITQQLDKASIIRLAISYFKLKDFFSQICLRKNFHLKYA
jgi:hypothetical protein